MAKSAPLISLDVVNYRAELAKIEEEVMEMANAEIQTKMVYAVAKLKVVTPVDTGEARLGWSGIPTTEVGGNITDGYIVNEVEHIEALNNGSSKQAPRYFIEQVLSTIGLITPL